jgi:hypothetical protein
MAIRRLRILRARAEGTLRLPDRDLSPEMRCYPDGDVDGEKTAPQIGTLIRLRAAMAR